MSVAIENDDWSMVEALLELGVKPNGSTNGLHFLHLAAKYDATESAKVIFHITYTAERCWTRDVDAHWIHGQYFSEGQEGHDATDVCFAIWPHRHFESKDLSHRPQTIANCSAGPVEKQSSRKFARRRWTDSFASRRHRWTQADRECKDIHSQTPQYLSVSVYLLRISFTMGRM